MINREGRVKKQKENVKRQEKKSKLNKAQVKEIYVE